MELCAVHLSWISNIEAKVAQIDHRVRTVGSKVEEDPRVIVHLRSGCEIASHHGMALAEAVALGGDSKWHSADIDC